MNRSHISLLFLPLASCFTATAASPDEKELQNLMERAMIDLVYVDGLTQEESALIENLKSKPSPEEKEVLRNLKEIKTAEISYDSYNDVYLPAKPYPPKSSGEFRKWNAKESGNFEAMGFNPYTKVQGTYWVDVDESTYSFTAYGIIDADGDGVFATYTATKTENPKAKKKTAAALAHFKEYTSEERKALADKMSALIKKFGSNMKEKTQGDPSTIVGALLAITNSDKVISEREKAALETYRNSISPEKSMEVIQEEALRSMKEMQYKAR